MFQDKKSKLIPKGDYVTENEALMDDEWEIRSRCESVHDVVTKNVIPLSKALKAYEVTLEQYMGYVMMEKPNAKISMDATTLIMFAQIFLGLVDIANAKLDNRTKRLVEDMRQLSVTS